MGHAEKNQKVEEARYTWGPSARAMGGLEGNFPSHKPGFWWAQLCDLSGLNFNLMKDSDHY